LHLGQFGALFCKAEGEEVDGEGAGNVECFWEGLDNPDNAANAEVVVDKLMYIWSMFQSNWMTDGLSNLSKMEIVLITSSKECGSTLMMAMTASSS
jgi:hypothetical protein